MPNREGGLNAWSKLNRRLHSPPTPRSRAQDELHATQLSRYWTPPGGPSGHPSGGPCAAARFACIQPVVGRSYGGARHRYVVLKCAVKRIR